MEEIKLLGIDFGLASEEMLEVLLDDVAEQSMFFEIAQANVHRPAILKLLMDHPSTPDEVRRFVSEKLPLSGAVKPARTEEGGEVRRETMVQKIQKLTVSARIQLALKGGREIRNILARDPNKEVSLGVLENGKITESEVEAIARSRTVLEEALRRISKNREWMKRYAIVFAVVTNPKTPAGLAVAHLHALKTRDLELLEKNKNAAHAVRAGAKRLVQARRSK
jgi:hypothetical protein